MSGLVMLPEVRARRPDDDEPDLEALVLQRFRRQINGGVVTFMFARAGIEALQLIELRPDIELVVTDINMPRMDGLSHLAKLQQGDEKKSTIIVSAYGDMSNIRIAMNRGAFDFPHQADRFRRRRSDNRQDDAACRDAARNPPSSDRGGARPCFTIALFLASVG